MADWKRKIGKTLNPKFKITIGIGSMSGPRNGTGPMAKLGACPQSYLGGGYTGNAPTNSPVGVVHGQEYVIPEPVVRAMGGPAGVETMLGQTLQGLGAPGFQTGGTPTWQAFADRMKTDADRNTITQMGQSGADINAIRDRAKELLKASGTTTFGGGQNVTGGVPSQTTTIPTMTPPPQTIGGPAQSNVQSVPTFAPPPPQSMGGPSQTNVQNVPTPPPPPPPALGGPTRLSGADVAAQQTETPYITPPAGMTLPQYISQVRAFSDRMLNPEDKAAIEEMAQRGATIDEIREAARARLQAAGTTFGEEAAVESAPQSMGGPTRLSGADVAAQQTETPYITPPAGMTLPQYISQVRRFADRMLNPEDKAAIEEMAQRGATIDEIREAARARLQAAGTTFGEEAAVASAAPFGQIPTATERKQMAALGTTQPPPETPFDYQSALRDAIGSLRAYSVGISPADRKIANSMMGYMQASNAAERAAYEQELAQMGLSPSAAAAHLQLLGRQQRSEESQLAGQLAQRAGDRSFQATGQLGQLGLSGAQFGEGQRQFDENMAFLKQKYGDEAGSRMAQDAASGMSFDTWQAKYPTGTRQDWERMQTMYEQTVTGNELSIQAQRMGLTTNQAKQVSDLIGMGFDVNQVNQRLGTNLDPTQFANLYAATPLGERDYQRDMQMANTLLSAGDFNGASSILTQRFPGVPIDFGAQITRQNAAFYQQGMEMLAKMVNTPGMDADDAAAALQKSGLLERMGVTADEAKALFKGMKVNAIDESWSTIEQSDAYKQLLESDPERAENIKTIWEQTAFGDMELAVLDRYNVYDQDGKLVASVAGEEKANEVAAKYGTQPVNTGKKAVVMKSDAEGDFSESDEPETIGDYVEVPKDSKPGDVFIDNGITYKYDPVAGVTETTYTDPFETTADKLLALGPENNPYYEDIVTARAAAYAGGDKPLIPGELSYDDPVYKKLASMSILKNGVGSRSIDKSGVQSKENYYYENLEGLTEGDLFRINGVVYAYDTKEEITRFDIGDKKWNPVIYYMVDVATGQRKAVVAWADGYNTTVPVDAEAARNRIVNTK